MSKLLHHLIDSAAAQNPNAEALRYRDQALSYGELQQQIEFCASGLQALGLEVEERVAVYLPKQLETVVALFATARADGIFVPVNPILKAPQVKHILVDSGAAVLITSRDRLKLLAEVLPACSELRHIILVDGDSTDDQTLSWQQLPVAHLPETRELSADATVALLYTSGSTGKPKGVMVTHRNLVLGAESVVQYLETTPNDRILAVLPLSFDYGLSQLTTAFCAGASVVLLNYLLPRDVPNAVRREGITQLAAVPSLWAQLAPLEWPAEARDSLRVITSSGGAMPAAVLARLQAALPQTRIYLMYGLTEAFRSTYLPPEELARRPGSMGKAIPHAELAVLREDGTPCDPGEPGELVHSGPLVAQGYWNNPEKTLRHFRHPPPVLEAISNAPRAVWSGDTVTVDEDGYYTFVGRRDHMIKTSGYRVSPTEVEEAIYATGLANEVAVFGVPHPVLGQGIVAVLTAAADAPADIAEAIVQSCKQQLPNFMVPLHVELRDELPRTPHGKIDRPALAQALRHLFDTTE